MQNIFFPKMGFLFFMMTMMVAGNVVGQIENSIVLDTANANEKNAFIARYEVYSQMQLDKMKKIYKDKAGKSLIKEYKENVSNLIAEVKDNQFVFDDEIDKKVKEILSKFVNKDIPEPSKIPFLINKDITLNAYCLSDGLLMINIGIFLWLDNDEQIASIVAHELGHYTLEHYNKYMYSYLQDMNDMKSRHDIRDIKNSNNSSKLALQILRKNLYNNARQKREQELEADSIGFIYYASTDYAKGEFLKAMLLMLKYDSLPYVSVDTSIYRTLFDLPDQPFNPNWLRGEDFSAYHYDEIKQEINKDSVASHPSFDIRIDRLIANHHLQKDTQIIEPSEEYKEISKRVYNEILPTFYFNEEYGYALYNTIRNLQKDNQNQTYKKWLGFLFGKIYEARKGYILNRYVENVNMRSEHKSYQQFLSFIWQLNIHEIEAIAKYYQTQSP